MNANQGWCSRQCQEACTFDRMLAYGACITLWVGLFSASHDCFCDTSHSKPVWYLFKGHKIQRFLYLELPGGARQHVPASHMPTLLLLLAVASSSVHSVPGKRSSDAAVLGASGSIPQKSVWGCPPGRVYVASSIAAPTAACVSGRVPSWQRQWLTLCWAAQSCQCPTRAYCTGLQAISALACRHT